MSVTLWMRFRQTGLQGGLQEVPGGTVSVVQGGKEMAVTCSVVVMQRVECI